MTDRNIHRSIQASHRIHDIIHPSLQNKSLRPKQPLRSNTLMRTAVTKPIAQTTHPIKNITTGRTRININNATVRRERAINSPQSDLISRFKQSSPDSLKQDLLITTSQPIEELIETGPPPQPPQLYKPLEPEELTVRQAPASSIFEKHLVTAVSHLQPPVEPSNKKSLFFKLMTTTALSALVLVIAGGFFAYLNFNKIGIDLASSKAGFHATLPTYKPSGFDLSGISTATGIVETSYHSSYDSKNFTINEKASNISNSDLLNTYVINTAGFNYQTVQQSGKTIYLYGKGNATWVNKGIWYIVSSDNSALSNQQLIKIATTS